MPGEIALLSVIHKADGGRLTLTDIADHIRHTGFGVDLFTRNRNAVEIDVNLLILLQCLRQTEPGSHGKAGALPFQHLKAVHFHIGFVRQTLHIHIRIRCFSAALADERRLASDLNGKKEHLIVAHTVQHREIHAFHGCRLINVKPRFAERLLLQFFFRCIFLLRGGLR